jgi:peptidyl-prolyl isomerase D
MSESIRYLDVHPVLPENSPQELKDSYESLLAPLLLNSALAALRTQPPATETTVKNTTRALDRLQLSSPDKAKALYRRASAYVIMKQEDEAEADLVAASQLAPEDPAILGELAKVRQKKKEKREREKKSYKKLFA